MNARELIGLAILATSVILIPFGYWLDHGWYIVAVVLVLIGGSLFFTARMFRKASRLPAIPDHLDSPYLPAAHLRGFPGARIKENRDFEIDIDGEGD